MNQKQVSLATRNALVYFLLFVIGITLATVLFFSYSSEEIVKLNEKRLDHTEEMIQLKFETYLDQIERDLNQLYYSPLLENYINSPSSDNLDLLTKEYNSFVRAKADYFQIRLITSDTSGMEIIRVERKADSIFTCPQEELQYKGNRGYFKEINTLPLDSLYVSKIDLNREYGEVVSPRLPTLRIGKNIIGEALKELMLVVNVDLKPLFKSLHELTSTSYDLRIFNQDGHYLIHPDSAASFTFDYQLPPMFNEEFDLSIPTILQNGTNITDKEAISHFFQLKYPRNNYSLYGIVSAKNETIFASFYSWRNKIVLMAVLIAFGFLLVAFIYMRRQAKELKLITNQLTSFSSSMTPKKLIVNRKDEIGALAKSFEKMSSEIYASHNEAAIAKEKAETAYNEKNEFLENMSHEIRNPLQTILGATEILTENEASPQQQPILNSLKFSTIQLNSLVTDILDYSKLKNDQIVLIPEWIDIELFCSNLIHSYTYEANKKNIKLQFNIDENLKPHLFYFDAVRVYQVLNNLLINALKFTAKDGLVKLTVDYSNAEIRFSIADTGKGISTENLNKILQRSVTSNYTTGSGLGLAIVHQLLTLHNTELGVKSEVGKGSEFYFQVQLAKKLKLPAENTINSSTTSTNKPLDILIVEDDESIINLYQQILDEHNIKSYSSLDAVKITNEKFDLIFSDLNYGQTTGTAESIKAKLNPLLKNHGKILIISGSEIDYWDVQMYSVTKPFNTSLLKKLANNYQYAEVHGHVNFERIIADYDQQSDLIINALSIQVSEWTKDRAALEMTIINGDTKKYNAIVHRILSSVKGFQLNDFENFLDALNLDGDTQARDEKATLLSEKMMSYISQIEIFISLIKTWH